MRDSQGAPPILSDHLPSPRRGFAQMMADGLVGAVCGACGRLANWVSLPSNCLHWGRSDFDSELATLGQLA
jgi:hypothetical protein